MFKAIAIGLIASPLALGGASASKLQPSIKRAVYDDSAYKVTFTTSELNNIEFTNLQSYLDDINSSEQTALSNTTVTYNGSTGSFTTSQVENDHRYVIYDSGNIMFGYALVQSPNHWYYKDAPDIVDFEYDLTWNVGATLYEGIKTALQLDIQDSEESMPSISGIFEQITSAIGAFVGSLGSAFTHVTSLFYADGNWTFLGILVLIGVGVGLFYGAYRIIKGLLHRV